MLSDSFQLRHKCQTGQESIKVKVLSFFKNIKYKINLEKGGGACLTVVT